MWRPGLTPQLPARSMCGCVHTVRKAPRGSGKGYVLPSWGFPSKLQLVYGQVTVGPQLRGIIRTLGYCVRPNVVLIAVPFF